DFLHIVAHGTGSRAVERTQRPHRPPALLARCAGHAKRRGDATALSPSLVLPGGAGDSRAMSTEAAAHGPLSALRVLEIGHFVAAPFCTRLLADLGADVIKIEPPAGDPVRQWGKQIDGHSAWWSLHGRNKRSITLNLKHPKAIDIVL